MALDLTRTVKFSLLPDGSYAADAGRHNTFAGWPSMAGLGFYFELRVTCRGEADPATGYFINIKEIDRVAREHALPLVSRYVRESPQAVGGLLREMIEVMQEPLDRTVVGLQLQLTPTYAVAMEADAMQEVLLKQQYEFSAAHRLHVAGRSEAENQATFGKCNNPNGHGHNYRFETVVASPVAADGSAVDLTALEKIVDEVVVERFDHKHLNQDTSEFAELNPSVEHIVGVIAELLKPAFAEIDCRLVEVTCWETGKTSCTLRV